MEWIIDIGNTSSKIAIFDQKGLQTQFRFGHEESIPELPAVEKADSCIVSATTSLRTEIAQLINTFGKVVELDHQTPVPFTNKYQTPETLGRDRIAGVVAAKHRFPDKNCLVIDSGTSITYDMITDEGVYIGGSISPGLVMRSKALHTFTGKLPLIDIQVPESHVGVSTKTSIQTGVFYGMVYEINGMIDWYSKQYEDLQILMCGGDAELLVNHLNYRIFANPNNVLEGLHQILLYNAD